MCFTLEDEMIFAEGQKSNLKVCPPEMKKTVNQVAEP